MSIRRFFRRRYWDDERAREIEAHLAHEIDENLARGMTPEFARAAAYRRFGNPTLAREEIYRMNTIGWLEALWQDARYGVRLLRRNPTFAAVAIVTLALGTGANTAIFELMNAVWLRPLPVERPQDLAEIRLVPGVGGRKGSTVGRFAAFSEPQWEALQSRQRVFSSLAVFGAPTFDTARGGPIQPVAGLWVSGTFFDTLGVRAYRGRTIAPSDDVRGCGTPHVVISYPYWRRHFAGDPSAIGGRLSLDGHPVDIIGVTPPGFTGIEVGRAFDVAVPLCAYRVFDPQPEDAYATTWFLGAIGRLAPGVSVTRAAGELTALSPAIAAATMPADYDASDRARYLQLRWTAEAAAAGVSTVRQQYEQPVWLLLAIAGMVLVIACANLANLMLARATARQRELAVRLAIGASRSRVLGQLVAESLVIALLGTAAGLYVARFASAALVGLLSGTGAPLTLDVSLDWRVLGFSIVLALVACVIFGALPAFRATAMNAAASLKDGARGGTDAGRRVTLRHALVVVQVALSLVLVVAALLFARTLRNLSHEDAGFDPNGLFVASLGLDAVHPSADPRALFHERLLARVRAIPGVEAAAEVSILPIDGSVWNRRIAIDGREQSRYPMFNAVTPGYFAAMRTPIVTGRDFTPADATADRVAIVNETFARAFLGAEALGRTVEVIVGPGTPRQRLRVIGVAADTKYSGLRQPLQPIVYIDTDQTPAEDSGPHVVVRSALPAAALAKALTPAFEGIDPRIVLEYRTMESVIEDAVSRERLMALLSAAFGLLAIAIALVGLYGVMSYTVTRRRQEIGIRMALGAEAPAVVRMVLRDATRLVAAGLVAGVAISLVAARAAASLLYGVGTSDPPSLALGSALLAAVALGAAALPAWRASHISPTIALRQE